MPQHKHDDAAPRSKLLDAINLLLAGVAVVAIALAIGFLIAAYDAAPWMPHEDRAIQLFATIFGFVFGVAYLHQAWLSRRLEHTLACKPHLRPLASLMTCWWIPLSISVIAFAVGAYSLTAFLGLGSGMRAGTVPALVQILGGTVLVVSSVTMILIAFKVQGQVRLTASLVVFGIALPAVLLVSGVGRLIIGCRQLVR